MDSSPLTITNKKYAPIPLDHPYNDKVLELLDRMLTVTPEGRASIEDVQESIRAIQNGTPLPMQSILTKELNGQTRHDVDANAASVASDRDEDERESDVYSSDYASSANAPLTAFESMLASSVNGGSEKGVSSLVDLSVTNDHRSVTSGDDSQCLELPCENHDYPVLENQKNSGIENKHHLPNSRNSMGTDPLNLDETGASSRKIIASGDIISDWNMGIRIQGFTQILNPVESETPTEYWADDEDFAVGATKRISVKKFASRTSVNGMSSAATHLLEEGTMNATESSLVPSLHLLEKRIEAGVSDFSTNELVLGSMPVASIESASLALPMPAIPETIIEPVSFPPGQKFDADKYVVYNPDLDASSDTSSSSDDNSKDSMEESAPALVESCFHSVSPTGAPLQETGNELSAFQSPRRPLSILPPDLKGESKPATSSGIHNGCSDVEQIDVDMARATLKAKQWLEFAAKSKALVVKSDIKSKTSSRKMADGNKKSGKSKSKQRTANTSDVKPKTQSRKKSTQKSFYLNPDDISIANSSITMEN